MIRAIVLGCLLLASPAWAGDLASFQLSTRWYPNGQMPCSQVPAPLVDAFANVSNAPIYIRSIHATLSTPPGMNSDTGLNVDLFHDPRYGGQVPLYHESVDHYAEPDSPSSLPPYEFAPDYVILRPGEYVQLHVGCALQPGNRATPAWLSVTVTVFYTLEPPTGSDLLWGWLDTDPMILPCDAGSVVSREWVNRWGVPIGLRLLHAWPGISGGSQVRATAEVWSNRPIREARTTRPQWGEPQGPKDRLLRQVWDRYAEPSGSHSAVVTFRGDRVVLQPGESISFDVSCRGVGFHQQNLLFFYAVG